MSTGWGIDPTYEHTFSTGRTAVLRRVVNLFAVVRHSALGLALMGHLEKAAAGQLQDPSVALDVLEAVVVATWAKPEVMPPGDDRERVADERVQFDDLFTEEVSETYDLWQASLEDVARFRNGSAGARNGSGGEGVADPPKPAPRPRARKRAGVAD